MLYNQKVNNLPKYILVKGWGCSQQRSEERKEGDCWREEWQWLMVTATRISGVQHKLATKFFHFWSVLKFQILDSLKKMHQFFLQNFVLEEDNNVCARRGWEATNPLRPLNHWTECMNAWARNEWQCQFMIKCAPFKQKIKSAQQVTHQYTRILIRQRKACQTR